LNRRLAGPQSRYGGGGRQIQSQKQECKHKRIIRLEKSIRETDMRMETTRMKKREIKQYMERQGIGKIMNQLISAEKGKAMIIRSESYCAVQIK